MTVHDTEKQTSAESVPLSTLPVTAAEMHAIAAKDSDWQYEEGPRGADRWRNTDTGDLVWQRPAGAPEPERDDPTPDGVEAVGESDIERGREQAAQLVDEGRAGVFVEHDDVAEQVVDEGGKFFAAVDDDMADAILDTQGGLYDYDDPDDATVASVDAGASLNWMMGVNAARAGEIGGTIQHELAHVAASIHGYEVRGEASEDVLPSVQATDETIDAKTLTERPEDAFQNDDDFADFVTAVNDAFARKRRRAREIQRDVPEDAEGTDQFAGMAFLEAESPSDRAYAMVDAGEFLAETVRTVTGEDQDKRDFLKTNYPDVYDAATDIFDVVPGDDNADESEPVVGEADEDEAFTTYSECVDVHDDKRDPEAYCAVIFGFDEEPDEDEEDDAMNQAAITMAATPEGVPDNYNYLPPEEEPPEGHDVVESDRGATYISPKPADGGGDEPQPGQSLANEVSEILGPDPGRDEFEAAEFTVEAETGINDVDFSSFDAAQAERASAELGRLADTGDLDGLESFRSSVPESVRVEHGEMPFHYDRDGRGVSITPQAMDPTINQELADAGITATGEPEHMIRHSVGQHRHAETVAENPPEGDPTEPVADQAEEAGVEPEAVQQSVSELALASGAMFVSELYTLYRGDTGVPTADQISRLYRFLGGPTPDDVFGDDE